MVVGMREPRGGGRSWTGSAAQEVLAEGLLAEGGDGRPTGEQRRALLRWLTADLTGHREGTPSIVEGTGVTQAALRSALLGVISAQVRAALAKGGSNTRSGASAGNADGTVAGDGPRNRQASGAKAAGGEGVRPATARRAIPLNDLDAFPSLSSSTSCAKPPSPQPAPRRLLVPTRIAPQALSPSDPSLPQQPPLSLFSDALLSAPQPHSSPPPLECSWPSLGPQAARPNAEAQPSKVDKGRLSQLDDTLRQRAAHATSQHPQLNSTPPTASSVSELQAEVPAEAASNGDARWHQDDGVSIGREGVEARSAGGGEGSNEASWDEGTVLFWLAEGHAALLRAGGVSNLADEFGNLVELLGTSVDRPCQGISPQQQEVDPGHAAPMPMDLAGSGLTQAYAIAVLRGAGRLIQAAPPRLLGVLLDPHSLVGAKLASCAPELQAMVKCCVAEERQRRLHSEKAYNSVSASEAAGRGASSLVGLSWTLGQDHNQGSRSHQEQRRATNLERCRDDFVKLMQEASRASFASVPKLNPSGASIQSGSEELRAGGEARMASAGGNEDMVSVLKRMRYKASELLQTLQPGNLSGFAAIFLGGFLQAARTGEAVMDDQLASLEQKDPSRFQRLSQRFHSKPGAAAGTSCGGRGGGRGSSGGGRGGGGRGGRGNGGSYSSTAETDEQALVSLALADEFPASLQLYVIFLEACDSARLNAAIAHSTAMRLTEFSQLWLPNDGDSRAMGGDKSARLIAAQQLGDRVAQLTSLALLLSYFSFASASPSAGIGVDSASTVGGRLQTVGPVELDTVVRQMAVSDGPGLATTLPWLLAYLRFLPRHPAALVAARRSALLPCLAALYRRPELRPADTAFGAAALCLRSLLDDWAAHSGAALLGGDISSLLEWEAADTTKQARTVVDSSQSRDAAFSWDGLPQALLEMAAAMDSRYAAQCCPALEEAVQRTMARLAGSTGAEALRSRSQARRLTPSQPKADVRRLSVAPPAVLAAASPVHDAVKLRLQKAFLDEYSGLGQKVALREMVAYVSDVAAANAVTSATLPTQLGRRLAPFERWLRGVMEAAANGEDEVPEGVLRQKLLASPALGEQFEQKVDEATYEALEGAFEQASSASRSAIGVALRALVPPLLEDPVVRTASAIATEYAASSCAQQLLEVVPSQVQQLATQACQRMAATVAREVRQSRTRTEPTPSSSTSRDAVGEEAPTPVKAGTGHPKLPPSLPPSEPSTSAAATPPAKEALRSTTRAFGGWRISAVALHRRSHDDDVEVANACICMLDEEGSGEGDSSPSAIGDRTPPAEASTPTRQMPSKAHQHACAGIPTPRDVSPGDAAMGQFTPLSARLTLRGPRTSTEGSPGPGDSDDPLHGNGPTPLRLAALLEEVAGGCAANVVHGLGATPQIDERKARALQSRIDPLQVDGPHFNQQHGHSGS